MTINTKIVVIATTAVIATCGAVWMTLRKKKSPEQPLAIEAAKEPVEEAACLVAIATDTAEEAQAIETVEETPEESVAVVQSPVEAVEVTAIVPEDVVETIITPAGGDIVAVSRIRVALPIYWTHFLGKIARPTVVELSVESFENTGSMEFSKGWHKCTLNGHDGVMHVTKGHVSAVVVTEANEFLGISTSARRFGGRGLLPLSLDEVKSYLNGR